MAPRGLSAEEKRVKMLEIFHETKDFFQLKELEKIAPKMKGIVPQSVKEVVQSLVDDGLVMSDKIGTSNFYWSFPSNQAHMLTIKAEQLKKNCAALEKSIAEANRQLEVEKSARVETPEREAALVLHAQLSSQLKELQGEYDQYGASDPVKFEEMKKDMEEARENAQRYTDNTMALISYLQKTFFIDPKEFRQFLEIPDDWEDI
ncbi:hypothetical protein FRC03_002355 [Tulasnella sp. 419]|nr:hypothetical protein FRC02_010435 [Tulasnella sp. 418]KAG8969494.1 hypothetical protein FRC03_002355 [Tulasnella sp. 419]